MKVKIMHPLISCLCFIENNSQSLLKVILCFDWQNYPNRELVICFASDDMEAKNLLNSAQVVENPRVRLIERPKAVSSRIAWQIVINHCYGEYICLWSIDVLHDIYRISTQFNILSGYRNFHQATILTRIMLYSPNDGNTFISHTHKWADTLLCSKVLFREFIEDDFGDINLDQVVDILLERRLLKTIDNQPLLYVYCHRHVCSLSNNNFKYFLRMAQNILQPHFHQFHSYFQLQYNLLLK